LIFNQKYVLNNLKQRLTIKSRDLRPSNRLAMHTYLKEIEVSALVKTKDTCAEKLEIFQSILKNGLDQVVPYELELST
jgi:hypothetical protein